MNKLNDLCNNSGREKWWKELTADEKLERMRTVVKRQEGNISRLTDLIYVLKDNFGRHNHNNGDVSVLYESRDKVEHFSPMPKSPQNPDEVYF